MLYIGVDLHKNRTRMVVMNQEGEILERKTIISDADSFREAFSKFPKGEAEIAMEATSNWYWASDVFEDLGLKLHLANPHRVRIVAESTVKTDTNDAYALAHLLRLKFLPKSRITPRDVRLLRERLRCRIALVRERTGVKGRIHALLGKCGIRPPEFSDLFGKAGREWMGRLKFDTEYRLNLDSHLRLIDFLTEEIKKLDDWLRRKVSKNEDVRLLMSIPGIGIFSAALILAELGDINFFRDRRRLSSFIGVVPGARNSGDVRQDGPLKADSNRYVRWVLAEGASKAKLVVPAWRDLYNRVHAGNDKRRSKARVAVMHKMACAIWRALKTREPFDPYHNCPQIENKNGELVGGPGLK